MYFGITAITLLCTFFLNLLIICKSASIYQHKRQKRGILSRSGICPNPVSNFVVKDTRLNFYGFQYFLPGEQDPPCSLSECKYDNDCHGDRKCCSNHCGGLVCTEAERDPHPCANYQCPVTKVCKIQRVRCIEPLCPDMQTISRPICVNGGPVYQMGKRSGIPRPFIHQQQQQYYNKYTSNAMWYPQEVVWSPEKPYYESNNNAL